MPEKTPDFVSFVSNPSEIKVQAASEGAGGKSLPRFSMVAYTGGPLLLDGWSYPVVVDLAGLAIPSQKRPIRAGHDSQQGVGHTTEIAIVEGRLLASGVISRGTDAAKEVVYSATNDFPWKASIGAAVKEREFLQEGQQSNVNGRAVSGPAYIVRKSILGEISFVDLGADDQTSVTVTAQQLEREIQSMSTETKDTTTEPTTNNATAKAAGPTPNLTTDTVADIRAAAAAETQRIAAVRKACSGQPDIEAKAIAEGWTADRAELEVLRASRPASPAAHVMASGTNAQVLECAIRMNSSEQASQIEAAYDDKTLDLASRYRRMGIRGAIEAACAIDGRAAPQAWASESDVVQAAFSTATLPGILGNTMNKSLLAAYRAATSMARRIAKKLTANDFKTHTGYRVTGDAVMKPVGAAGELAHGTLGESSYSYSVGTVGRTFGITRQMLINDDLGALMAIPQMLGRGAALAIEKAFWTLVLANTGGFFASGNKNYISGAATVLGLDSLGQAVQKFRDQTDENGDPIAVEPKFLVVPTALEMTAVEIYKSTNIVLTGSTDKKSGATNIYAGSYEPVVSSYLGNSSYTGYSATAWYLFGDPNDIAAFGIAFLNGNESPTIEEVQQAPDVLGRGWRGYLDFGVCQLDPRGAVKSKGAS